MTRNLTADLAAELRTRIVDGVIQPGDKLPSENALMGEFGVSRTVVRAALTRLQAEGLVETERGRGSFALTPPDDGPQPVPGSRPVASVEDRLHLLEFRMGVEAEAAALAARNHSDRQLRAVNAALEQFTASADHPGHAMKADFEFHRAIAAASGNPFYSGLPRGPGPDDDRDAAHPADDRRRALRPRPLRPGGPRAPVHRGRHR